MTVVIARSIAASQLLMTSLPVGLSALLSAQRMGLLLDWWCGRGSISRLLRLFLLRISVVGMQLVRTHANQYRLTNDSPLTARGVTVDAAGQAFAFRAIGPRSSVSLPFDVGTLRRPRDRYMNISWTERHDGEPVTQHEVFFL